MSKYFVAKNGVQSGPFLLSEIVEQLGCATLSLTDYIYDDEKGDWVLLMSHNKLGELLNQQKPSLPPPIAETPEPEELSEAEKEIIELQKENSKVIDLALKKLQEEFHSYEKNRTDDEDEESDKDSVDEALFLQDESSVIPPPVEKVGRLNRSVLDPAVLKKEADLETILRAQLKNSPQEEPKIDETTPPLELVKDLEPEPEVAPEVALELELENESDPPLPSFKIESSSLEKPVSSKSENESPLSVAGDISEDTDKKSQTILQSLSGQKIEVEEDVNQEVDEYELYEADTAIEPILEQEEKNYSISAESYDLPKVEKAKISEAFNNVSNCVYQAKLEEIKQSEGSEKEKAIKFSKALEEVVDPLLSEWYILKDSNKYGPYTYKDMLNMLDQKFIYGFDFVWHKSLSNWRRIADLEAFSYENINKLKNTYLPELTQVYYRRRHKRVNYGHSILVHDNSRVWKANSVQIGEGGVGVIMEQDHVVPGQVVYLHFQPGDGVPPFNAVCEVVSKKLQDTDDGKAQKVFYGMKFQKISNNISQLVDSLAKKAS